MSRAKACAHPDCAYAVTDRIFGGFCCKRAVAVVADTWNGKAKVKERWRYCANIFCDRCAVIKSVYQKSQSLHATSFVSDGKGCHVTYIRGDPAAHGGKCGKVQSVERLLDVFVKFGWQI